MKKLKRLLALVMAMAMVVAMALPAMAAGTTTTPPDDGSITVKSPVVSATYNVYKVFDMQTNADVDAFSYTIDTDNPFYADIAAWAATPANGLVLSEITTEKKESDPSYKKFVVQASTTAKPITVTSGETSTTYGNFDPQVFGQMLLTAMTRETNPVNPTPAKTAITATVDKSDKIEFKALPLGYYLVNASYPNYTEKTPTLGEGTNQKSFEKKDFVIDENTDQASALSATGLAKVDEYVAATVTDAYVDKYLKDKAISTNKDGKPLTAAGKEEYKADLITAMTKDAKQKVLDAYNNDAADADINVKKPILVFLDSSQPDAVINEKNELNKWDVPVNPTADTEPGTPDHGEPKGGKNIVVQEADPANNKAAYYADWSEAKIGDSVHYQLRVNAMNFIRNTDSTTLNQANAESVQQVKEYFLADYQSAHMDYDTDKGIKVSIWSGDNDNKNTEGASTGTDKPKNVTKKVTYKEDGTLDKIEEAEELDYGTQHDKFFMNSSTTDGDMATLSGQTNGIFGNNSGIMVPWTFVEKAGENYTPRTEYPIYTINKVPTGEYETEEIALNEDNTQKANVNPNGTVIPGQFISTSGHVVNAQGQVLDENNNPIQKYDTYYVYSIYNSDVTIVVDYYMILKDNAIVDEPGNKNFAQFAWSPVDNKDGQDKPKQPTNPNENTDKPSEFEEIDDATVFTCAIAWVKTDNKANPLAGAEFELPFYVKTAKDGKSYVYAMTNEEYTASEEADKATKYTNKVTTSTDDADGQKGVITIKGITSTKDDKKTQYKITETKAPDGYNKMTAPFYLQAKKSDEGVHTTTKTKIYKDAQGNITKTETSTFVEFVTDVDSFNKEGVVEPEETSVPVYEFQNIVNEQGAELPSTGGIGTTIFYVVGAILVIGAGVVLITKRRMDA